MMTVSPTANHYDYTKHDVVNIFSGSAALRAFKDGAIRNARNPQRSRL
jgi:hypothetical protein